MLSTCLFVVHLSVCLSVCLCLCPSYTCTVRSRCMAHIRARTCCELLQIVRPVCPLLVPLHDYRAGTCCPIGQFHKPISAMLKSALDCPCPVLLHGVYQIHSVGGPAHKGWEAAAVLCLVIQTPPPPPRAFPATHWPCSSNPWPCLYLLALGLPGPAPSMLWPCPFNLGLALQSFGPAPPVLWAPPILGPAPSRALPPVYPSTSPPEPCPYHIC